MKCILKRVLFWNSSQTNYNKFKVPNYLKQGQHAPYWCFQSDYKIRSSSGNATCKHCACVRPFALILLGDPNFRRESERGVSHDYPDKAYRYSPVASWNGVWPEPWPCDRGPSSFNNFILQKIGFGVRYNSFDKRRIVTATGLDISPILSASQLASQPTTQLATRFANQAALKLGLGVCFNMSTAGFNSQNGTGPGQAYSNGE